MRDKKPTILKDLIAPEHLLQAIDNSLMHCDETAHRVTGLHFENYTIIVHKRKGVSWYIDVSSSHWREQTSASSQQVPRRYDAENDSKNDSSLRSPEDGRKAS